MNTHTLYSYYYCVVSAAAVASFYVAILLRVGRYFLVCLTCTFGKDILVKRDSLSFCTFSKIQKK